MAEEKHELGHVEKTSTNSSSREAEAQQELDWTPEEEKEIVKKADWRVFPMLCIVFGLSLLDRTNISSAYIAGLETDLKLNIDNRYSVYKSYSITRSNPLLTVSQTSHCSSSSFPTPCSNYRPMSSSSDWAHDSGYLFSSYHGVLVS